MEVEEGFLSGWSFKISFKLRGLSLGWRLGFGRRLRRSDWKEVQEVPSGWNFKSMKLLRLEWSVGQHRRWVGVVSGQDCRIRISVKGLG